MAAASPEIQLEDKMKVLMCEPKYFLISYEINPWMKIENQVNVPRAIAQWQNLYQTIKNIADQVYLVEPQDNLPDMVFTANAALIHKNKAYISNFRFPERKNEAEYFNQWFLNYGLETKLHDKNQDYFFEGAGDALFMGDLLFYGYGFRSDKEFHTHLTSLFPKNIIFCHLIDPYFYHLDTCFCPVNEQFAIWYPYAFTPESRKAVEDKINVFAVPEAEARHFACNAVVLGDHIVMPAGCPETKKYLTSQGFSVLECDVSEFIKAGGACKCLTLLLD